MAADAAAGEDVVAGGGEAAAVQNAPSVLANLAGQQEQAALGYLSGGTGATANAANVFGTVYNQEQAQQAEALNFISSLAGVAGSALTGGMGGTGILSALTSGAKNTTKPVSWDSQTAPMTSNITGFGGYS